MKRIENNIKYKNIWSSKKGRFSVKIKTPFPAMIALGVTEILPNPAKSVFRKVNIKYQAA